MERKQEESLVFMFLMPLIVFVTGSAPVMLIYTQGMSFIALFMFVFMMGVFTFPLPISFFIQKIRKTKKVLIDERDLSIFKNATIAANLASWLFFFSVCLYAWWKVGGNGEVSVNTIPLTFVGCVTVYQFVYHVSSFIQNRTGGENGE